jgi:hypothetical protein
VLGAGDGAEDLGAADLRYRHPPPTAFLESLRAHPAVDWIREMYRRHRGASSEVRG